MPSPIHGNDLNLKEKYRIVVVDDHVAVRLGIKWLLRESPFEIVGESGQGGDAAQLCRTFEPDIAIVDIRLPDTVATDVVKELKQLDPAPRVLIYSATGHRQSLLDFLSHGIEGFVVKSDRVAPLLQALQALSRGETFFDSSLHQYLDEFRREVLLKSDRLSQREKDILRRVALSETTQDIANALHISSKTVEAHRRVIMRKTQSKNLAALTRCAIEIGLV
jgi:DNA-binding NarL/FixJ family response regulator